MGINLMWLNWAENGYLTFLSYYAQREYKEYYKNNITLTESQSAR